jgi:hypothetical protein
MKKSLLGLLITFSSSILLAPACFATFPGGNGDILYTKFTPYSGAYSSAQDDGKIYVANADGTNERIFRNDGYSMGYRISYSPLGGRIVWANNGSIYISDVNGDNIHLAARNEDLINPQWAPSGLSIFYTIRFPNYSGLNVIDINGSNNRVLLHQGYGVVSSDGNNYLYSSPVSPTYSLEYMDNILSLDETPTTLKTFMSGHSHWFPAAVWSPDSTKFAIRDDSTGENVIKIYNFQTKALIDQFSYPGYDPINQNISMLWSPDSTSMLISGNLNTASPFSENYTPDYAILSYNLTTHIATRLTTSWPGRLIDWQSVHPGMSEPDIPPTPAQTPTTKHVYRFYSPLIQRHLYTADEYEVNYIQSHFPPSIWRYEGTAFSVEATSSCAQDESVHRFYSEVLKSHLYTIDENEKNYISSHYPSSIWRYEGVSYCASRQQKSNATAVYRFYSNQLKTHLYTTDENEMQTIRATFSEDAWKYEGIAYYTYQ